MRAACQSWRPRPVAVPRWGRGDEGANALEIVASPAANLSGPQIVARPPNLAVLLTHCGQLLLRKKVVWHFRGGVADHDCLSELFGGLVFIGW